MSNDVKRIAEKLQGVDAPYNFVPLNRAVCTLPHASRVSHDVPFSDGISGRLEIEIETITPTCPGNQQLRPDGDSGPAHVHPMKSPDGRYVINGSSLRGMIRSVVETASFSRLDRYDSPFMSLRDLSGPVSEVYRRRMVDGGTGGRPFTYRGHAGWLQQNREGTWSIVPCKLARVFHKQLHELSDGSWRGFEPRADDKGKYTRGASAKEKYEEWIKAMNGLGVRHRPEYRTDQQSNIEAWYADSIGSDRGKAGTLVFTGQPAGYPRSKIEEVTQKKRVEFVFFDEDPDSSRLVEPDVLKAFFHINKGSDHWEYLKSRGYQNHVGNGAGSARFPVFYLTDEDDSTRVAAIGLAMMFRLPYQHDFRHAAGNADSAHVDGRKDDFSSLLFGHIGADEAGSLKGRLAFGNANSADQSISLEEYRVVLNSPKPSFYPAYLWQSGQEGGRLTGPSGAGYRTLQDRSVELRGRKRYPARPDIHPRNADSDKLDTVLHCLPAGSRFNGSIRLHNLRPIELGALLWSLDFGGRPDCLHSLGTGRPYGFGQVRLALSGHSLCRITGERVEPADCVREFVDYMEKWAQESPSHQLRGGWLRSAVMENLLAMTNQDNAKAWEEASGCQLRYLGEDLDGNDMPQLHQQVKNQRLKLPEYAAMLLSSPSDEPVSEEAEKWLSDMVAELMARHHIDSLDVLRGRLLVEQVQQLGDEALKRDVVKLIVSRWRKEGMWDDPPSGKAVVRARRFYQECLEELG